uniref:Uncharacterized protein n=1 Tax=Athene cunicularia TaxID=194338 RepID=A0A663MW49_ATHCN
MMRPDLFNCSKRVLRLLIISNYITSSILILFFCQLSEGKYHFICCLWTDSERYFINLCPKQGYLVSGLFEFYFCYLRSYWLTSRLMDCENFLTKYSYSLTGIQPVVYK